MAETLKQGSTGQDVIDLQTHLKDLGFYEGWPDGDFGPRTEAAVTAYREWAGFGWGVEADEQVQTRLAADAQAHPGGVPVTGPDHSEGQDAPPAADPNEGVRQAALSAARGEIGLVQAKTSGGADETGQQVRYGWERLMNYFHVAAPGVWPDDVIKYIKPGLPSWCGIFALWALKQGGASVGNWGMGTGIPGIQLTRDPKPGDIGYIDQPYQHYCLVERIEGDTVYSIDGNTVGDDMGGGEVNDRTRSRSAYSGFYTVFD